MKKKTGQVEDNPHEIIWGINGIAKYIGLDPRKTEYRVAIGLIPTHKVGRIHTGRKRELDAMLGLEDS